MKKRKMILRKREIIALYIYAIIFVGSVVNIIKHHFDKDAMQTGLLLIFGTLLLMIFIEAMKIAAKENNINNKLKKLEIAFHRESVTQKRY